MSRRPAPAQHLATLAEQASRCGAALLPVIDATRQRLVAALTEAAHRQEYTRGYEAELQLWTHRYTDACDGVPAAG
jgi:hypothetical protein